MQFIRPVFPPAGRQAAAAVFKGIGQAGAGHVPLVRHRPRGGIAGVDPEPGFALRPGRDRHDQFGCIADDFVGRFKPEQQFKPVGIDDAKLFGRRTAQTKFACREAERLSLHRAAGVADRDLPAHPVRDSAVEIERKVPFRRIQ